MTPRRRLRWGAQAAVSPAGGIGVWYRSRGAMVEVHTIRRGELRATVDGEGETRVRHRYVVSAPIGGRVARPTSTEGDSVRIGAEVARIDPGLLDPRMRAEQQAALRAAEDAEREAAARVREAQAALARSARDADRARQLYEAGHIASRELESATTAETRDREEVDATSFRTQQLAHESERIRAALGSSDGGRQVVRVLSPVRGVVLRIVERDERVVPAGAPLVELGDPRVL
jgi:HlyD family secretion protein